MVKVYNIGQKLQKFALTNKKHFVYFVWEWYVFTKDKPHFSSSYSGFSGY